MDTAKLTHLAIAGGILFAAYKYGGAKLQGAALSIAAVVAAKQIPYIKDYI